MGRFCRLNSFLGVCPCQCCFLVHFSVNADSFIDKMSDATYDRKNIICISACCIRSIWRMGFLESGKNESKVLEYAKRLSYRVGGIAV